MSDPVNREDVIKAIHKYWSEELDDIPVIMYNGDEIYADQKKCNEILSHNKALANRVKQLPSAEVEPVKHGKWIYEHRYYCSECGDFWAEDDGEMIKVFNYCPNCGAKMENP